MDSVWHPGSFHQRGRGEESGSDGGMPVERKERMGNLARKPLPALLQVAVAAASCAILSSGSPASGNDSNNGESNNGESNNER